MEKITPFLWFDNQAVEAANFYASIFKNSKVKIDGKYDAETSEVSGQKEGTVMTVLVELDGQKIITLNGGPLFKFTPATSFFVNCETKEEVDQMWEKLTEGGKVLMELGAYPFSERFGWVEDKFGVSWQLCLGDLKQKITPFLMFVGERAGKAEEAVNFYISTFKNSEIVEMKRHGAGGQEKEGTVMHAIFKLDGYQFMALDSALNHQFNFSQAISYIVNCETQEEVDHFWNAFSDGGEIQQCGWVIDRFGVAWQVVPSILGKLTSDPDPEKVKRVMHAMLQMKKLDIEGLKKAVE